VSRRKRREQLNGTEIAPAGRDSALGTKNAKKTAFFDAKVPLISRIGHQGSNISQ